MAFGNLLQSVANVLETPTRITGGFNPFPDLGISEALRWAGNTISPPAYADNSTPAGQTAGATTGPVYGPQKPAGPTNPGGGGSAPAPTSSTPGFDPNAAARQIGDQERAAQEAANQRIRDAIGSAYEPIFNELDRQIGIVPTQKADLEGQVGNLATSQKTDVGVRENKDVSSLEGNKAGEIQKGQGALRNLDENIRNSLLARSFYFGSLGAGDSSAPLKASEAITKAGLKTRGGILSDRNTALTEIDGRIADVHATASDQLRQIDDWKSTKLFDVGQWAIDTLNKLNSEKANAQGEKGKAIAGLIQNTEQQFISRLQQLDDAVFNYKSTVQQWQDKRAGELEDFKKKLDISSAYTSGTSTKYDIKMDQFGRAIAINPYNPSDYQVLPTGILSDTNFSGSLLDQNNKDNQDQTQPTSLGQFLGVGK